MTAGEGPQNRTCATDGELSKLFQQVKLYETVRCERVSRLAFQAVGRRFDSRKAQYIFGVHALRGMAVFISC